MRVTRPVASCLTYSLGKSLYIPLTSRCNTCTLPETRGPNFTLSAEVVASLCRVRDAENQNQRWEPWCLYLDSQESPQKLPETEDSVATLLQNSDNDPTSTGKIDNDTDDDGRYPSAEVLALETLQQLKQGHFESVVFAGEGEPTLRLATLLMLASKIRKECNSLPLRLTTNGLVYDENTAELLKSSGISAVSVALMTYDPDQYDDIMKPNVPESIVSSSTDNRINAQLRPHVVVCQFIQSAIKAGLTVEATGVARQDVNHRKTEALAANLGIQGKIRWRPYFP